MHFHACRRRHLFAECSASRVLCRGLMACLAPTHGQLRRALSDDLGLVHRFGPKRSRQRRVCDAASVADSDCAQPAAGLPQADRASPWDRVLARQQREDRDSRRIWHLLRRPRAERMGDCLPGCQQLELHHRDLAALREARELMRSPARAAWLAAAELPAIWSALLTKRPTPFIPPAACSTLSTNIGW